MNRPRTISLLGAAMALAAAPVLQAAGAPPTNVVLVMTDDLGWGDTGYNGSKVIKTPHLDRMAAEGLQMDRFYSASSVCSPTRASCLTGRNPYRTGIFTANQGILRPEEVTLPEILKANGYATGHFGKWHLGTLTHSERDANRGKEGNTRDYNPPKLHGYDVAFVTESKVPTYDPMKLPTTFAEGYGRKNGWPALQEGEEFTHYGTHYWDIEGNKVTEGLDGDDSKVMMDRVIPFIDRAIADKKPFLSVVWFHAPHLPCVAGPEYQEMYKDQPPQMRNYAGCVTALDLQIGRLRAHLADKGVAENTMIWFCSDNGPEHKDKPDNGSAGPFRGRKRDLYEGGIRVPGLLVWPAKIKQARKTDAPCVTSDFLPTIINALGIAHPKPDYILDGISLMPLVEGKTDQRPGAIGHMFQSRLTYANNTHKLVTYDGGQSFELYDIAKDPSETKDLAAQQPELVENLKKQARAWSDSARASFEGKEYGTESLERSGQKWGGVFDQAKKQRKGRKTK